jgi:hypothetical protein
VLRVRGPPIHDNVYAKKMWESVLPASPDREDQSEGLGHPKHWVGGMAL